LNYGRILKSFFSLAICMSIVKGSRFFSLFSVKRLMDITELLIGDMSVNLSGGDGRMTEH